MVLINKYLTYNKRGVYFAEFFGDRYGVYYVSLFESGCTSNPSLNSLIMSQGEGVCI